ncbi:MAG: histidinol-phosphate transaminase [Ilumatobacter fluminis]|uniref:histidinol-phosphate transaminase n=1 Tax=Ilumatobacter fluminis TaxID=467091 RepID=UPI0032EC3B9F
MSDTEIGRPRPVIAGLPAYRPGKGAKQAEAEHGITDAIKLASNENPAEPLPAIVEAITAAASGANRYADHRATAVRQALADRLGVSVEQVTVGNGTVGLLQQLWLSYVDPGDEVVYPWRSFEVYPVYTQEMAGTAVTVPLRDDLGFDLDGVVDAVSERTKLVVLATPNNPTGVACTTAELRTALERIPRSVIVCIDEAYREFLDPSFGDPVSELLPDFPNALVTRTMSKAHGLAGVRVGYAVGHPDVIATIDKTLVPFAVNALAQAAALAAIEHDDEIRRSVDGLLAERSRVESALRAAGWSLPAHQANFVWLALGDRTDEIALGLERRGVVVRPFSGEGIRVTIGTPAENDRFVAALAEVSS